MKSNYKKPVTNLQAVLSDTQQPTVTPQAKSQNLADQIDLDARYHQDRNKNISSLEITIRNNGSEILKSAAVEVFYYRSNNRLFDKKTVYITNVQPGNSFTLATPGNKKAQHAKFQLGKVE